MLGNLGADYKKQEEYFSSQKYKDKFKKGKGSGKRKLPHPKMLSYPVAVTPDEENGTRLLIKCFEYIPPKTSSNVGYKTKTNELGKTVRVGGVKYPPGAQFLDESGNVKTYNHDVKLENLGASDKIGQGKSHLYYVELPIPQDVNDSNTVTWGDNSLNIFQLAGLQVAARGINNIGEGFAEAKSILTSVVSSESGLPESTRNAVAAAIAGKAIDPQGQNIRPNSAISRATGQVLNSNLELLFDSVNLRTFPFSVTFSPRSPEESIRVKHIIRAFKSSMAAKKGTKPGETGQGGIFLKSPDVFQLRYLHNGDDHPFLNSFKHCALTGMTVNYTNAGTFASYNDGTPVSIQMNLTFKELNPIYQEDYDGFSSNDGLGVGF